MKNFSVIAACCQNRGIGVNNKLPWKLKNEMNYFTRITTSADNLKKNAVIMGRKSWFSIPSKYRPLAERVNLVLSRTLSEVPSNCDGVYDNLYKALEAASSMANIDKIFVIGGGQVYEEAIKLPECRHIYLTTIDAHFECDAFFPEIDMSKYVEIESDQVPKDIQEENGIKYRFHIYEQKANHEI